MIFAIAISFLMACQSTMADEATDKATLKNSAFKSAEYLYDKCKEALRKDDFENSNCAFYLEGYIRGGAAMGLTILGKAENQREIIEEDSARQCAKWNHQTSQDSQVKWLAKYLVNWFETNQQVIEGEQAFRTRPAGDVLFGISTNERFCTKLSTQGEK